MAARRHDRVVSYLSACLTEAPRSHVNAVCLSVCLSVCHTVVFRVATNLENMEKSETLKVIRESQGKCALAGGVLL